MYRKILVSGVTAAAILGAGTAALATTGSDTTAGTPSPSGTSTSSTHAKAGANGKDHKGKGKHSPLRRAAHAKITVKTKKGYVTRDLIRGTVTSVSASSISVQAGDKYSETFTVTKDTKVVARSGTKGAKPAASSISKVTKGQHVVVAGVGTSKATAKHIVDLGTK
ncbi:hypothetical protein [uncultured Jatrophihabitans sp.]|uniref:hypothetical protein n=1 Tax=uncultured Jatrophihabitans sp. TaxID=1610747 RepID=UPI0035CBEC9A